MVNLSNLPLNYSDNLSLSDIDVMKNVCYHRIDSKYVVPEFSSEHNILMMLERMRL